MKSISISGTKRADLGKKATKEVRKQGLVPCVIYGEKKDANGAPEAVHFVVDEKQINKLVYSGRRKAPRYPQGNPVPPRKRQRPPR